MGMGFINGVMVRILILSIGDKYEGEWKDSLKWGKGTEHFANGDKILENT
jgi:hypothetical protein